MRDNAETMALKTAGKLNQMCPADCRSGWRATNPGPEAAGYQCSACCTPTGAACWSLGERTDAQRAAAARLGARRNKETPKPGAVA